MFGWLAGVRYPELQHISVKGLPEDISISTQIGWNKIKVDAYEPSWLTAEEIVEWVAEFPELDVDYNAGKPDPDIGWLYGGKVNWWTEYKHESSYPSEIEDLRMVFWFS